MSGLWDVQTYLLPLQQPFMQRALIAVVLVGVLCAVIGSFVVLRGLAFLGEALRHAIFAGVVIAFVLGLNLTLGALSAALLVAWLIGALGRHEHIGEDTAIGILFSAALALGLALLSYVRAGPRDLATLLLGNILGISTLDLLLTALVGLLTLALVGLFFKELVLISFDAGLASALGRSRAVWDSLLLLLLALALTTTFQTVGNLLALALLLIPASTARLLTRRLGAMLLLASALSVGAGVSGLLISYWQNIPSGPAIVLVAGVGFGLAWLLAPAQGALWRLLTRQRLRRLLRHGA